MRQAEDISFRGNMQDVQVEGELVQVRQAVEHDTQMLEELEGTRGAGQAETHWVW